MRITRKYVWILGLALVFLFAAVAFAQGGRGEGRGRGQGGGQDRPPMKIVKGTVKSIDTTAKTVQIEVEKYVKRGEGEVAGNGEVITVTYGDKTRFGAKGEKADISAFKEGDEVVAIIVEKDGNNLMFSMCDPETAKQFRDKLKQGIGDRMRKHGMPLYGEVLKVEGEFVTIKPEPFPREELGLPEMGQGGGMFGRGGGQEAGPGGPGGGQGQGRELPSEVKIKLTDETKVFIGGAEATRQDIKVGDKFVFRCALPEGDWDRDHRPEFLIAKNVADIESVKKFIKEKMANRGQHEQA